jgi:hypothetical protein
MNNLVRSDRCNKIVNTRRYSVRSTVLANLILFTSALTAKLSLG